MRCERPLDQGLPSGCCEEPRAGGAIVGYAAAAFRNQSHPTDVHTERARYLVIYALGIHRHFQGVENSAAPGQRYAATIMDSLEGLARDLAAFAEGAAPPSLLLLYTTHHRHYC